LRTRVVTAVVLAAVVLGTLATGSTLLWAALVTCFCAAAAWEFARLSTAASRSQKVVSATLLIAVVSMFGCALFTDWSAGRIMFSPFLLIVATFWLCVAPFQLSRRAIAVATWRATLTMPIIIGGAWLCAVLLQRAGAQYLIAVVVLTVVADVAGYFVGRAFGRVKLAPSISPGKTREGAVGGVAAAGLWALGVAIALDLAAGFLPLVVATVAGAFLGGCAVLGDLWESQLKRQAGAKDSSQLLPGHGGVLDRIDAQLAVLPLATLLFASVRPLW
jgi:phosphatidate cytidylyltransferase